MDEFNNFNIILGNTGSGKTTVIKNLLKGMKFLYIGYEPISNDPNVETVTLKNDKSDITIEELSNSIQIVVDPIRSSGTQIRFPKLKESIIIIDEIALLKFIIDTEFTDHSLNKYFISLQTFAQLKEINAALFYKILYSKDKKIFCFNMYNLEAEDYQQLFFSRELVNEINAIELGIPVMIENTITFSKLLS